MLSAVRHRSTLLLRLLVLAVVALGTVGGPMASALAELHEMSHEQHPPAAHVGLAGDTGHDDEDAGARLLHALVHFGHCHGQGGMLPMAMAGWEAVPSLLRDLVAMTDGRWPSAPPETLLRPPIAA